MKSLYRRLAASLSTESPGEKLIFRSLGFLYRSMGFHLRALLPQVYLHLDPCTQVTAGDVLVRQRMDFLLLLPDGRRVVIEVDGKQHYATADVQASPKLYGVMMAEDRRIRLAGY